MALHEVSTLDEWLRLQKVLLLERSSGRKDQWLAFMGRWGYFRTRLMIVGRTLEGHHGRGFAILDEPRVGGRHFDYSSRFGLGAAACCPLATLPVPTLV